MKKVQLSRFGFILNIAFIAIILMFLLTAPLQASSHREAPLISLDPFADNTDLYAFRSPDNPDMITIIASYVPFQLPQGGPNWYGFSDHVRYEIHIDNDAGTPGDDVTYYLTFQRTNEDPTTFFNIRLGAQNIKTTYTLERSLDNGLTFETILENGIVPPPNIGPRSTESAVGLGTTYEQLIQDAIMTTTTGERVFCGPSDDPFFADLGGIFDLGNSAREDGMNRDGVGCFNVSTIALQIPITTLLKDGAPSTPTNILDPDYVIGVWASASRRQIRTFNTDGPDATYDGEFVQVSRLGMPLTNEAVVPIGEKDYWNAISPYDEITDEILDPFFYNPELALYMDDDQFGGAVPSFSPLRIQRNSLGAFDFGNGQDGLFPLKGSDAVAGTALDDEIFGTLLLPGPGLPRSVDLWPIFHTGAPNFPPYQLATGKDGNPLAAGKPFIHNFLPNGGDMLRLNMATPTTDRNSPDFSTLGLVSAAVLGLTDPRFNQSTDLEFIPNMDGFPNGRRLADDVTRIELQAVSGIVVAAVGLWYDDFDGTNPVTEDLLDVLTYTTGVESNDVPFKSSFPYVASPFSATGECGGVLVDEGDDDGEVDPFTDADLELSMTSPSNSYALFESVPFTITLTNNGPLNATGIVVNLPLPNGLVFSSSTVDAGQYNNFAGTWSIDVLGPGQSINLNQNLFSVSSGNINNFAQVASVGQNDPDSTPGNDTDQTADEDDEALMTVSIGGGTSGQEADTRLFVSSNTEGVVGLYNVFEDFSISMNAKATTGIDADGISFVDTDDRLIQLNRTDNRVDVFKNVSSSLSNSDPLNLSFSSSSDFTNGREIAVNKELVIVAQDASETNGNVNALVTYESDEDGISLSKTNNVGINLWGIHIIGSTLWAVVDNSNRLAVFENFFTAPGGDLEPGLVVEVEGLVRTHGLTYVPAQDLLILTDIGSAASADDGAILVINNFQDAIADGTISLAEQIRIGGNNTFLGNPVDVAYESSTDRIFVAERASGGGRVLGYNMPTASGNFFPSYNQLFAGASAIFAQTPDVSSRVAQNEAAASVAPTQSIALGTIFPLPAKNTVNATLNSSVTGMADFLVFDVNGKPISNFRYEVFEGANTISFDISEYPAGYYYLNIIDPNTKIKTGQNINTHKFLKVD